MQEQIRNMAPHAPRNSGVSSCGAALHLGQIIELAEIAKRHNVAIHINPDGAITIEPVAAPKRVAKSDAERQREHRQRKAQNNQNPVTNVTKCHEKRDTEPEAVTNVTKNVTQENLTLPPSPSPPDPPIPAHPPALSSARVREASGELPFDDIPPPKAKKSTPPPLDEWLAYAATLSPRYIPDDATTAWNFYEANGWRVGKNPVKDWQAACRTCHGRWIADERERAARRMARKQEREPPHGIAAQNALAEYT